MKTLKNIFVILLLCSVSIASAQTAYVLNDDFDEKGTWPVGNNKNRELKVFNGRYYFEYKKKEGSWNVATQELTIDLSRNFEIETSIQKISGVKDYAFGLLFNRDDNKNSAQFSLSSNGYFRVGQTKNGSYSKVKGWTESSKIKKGNFSTNKLTIRKKDGTVTFYINGENVYSTSSFRFTNKRIGVIIYRNQKISVDYFKVKYLSGGSNNNNSNNNNGHKVTKVILYDSFYSNKNDWSNSKNNDVEFNIRDSKYYFDHKRDKSGWTTSIEKYIDTNRDFKIEAKIKKVSGVLNNAFGIIWGRKDSDNQYMYTITGNGYFSLDQYKNGKLIAIKDWEKNSAINKGNGATNTLKITKIGNRLNFYANGDYMYSSDFKEFYGNRIGFVVYKRQKIAIDYLSIDYLDSKPNVNNVFVNNTINKGDAIMNEQFSNNSNDWEISSDEKVSYKLRNGKYYFNHKREKGGYYSTIKHSFDNSKDFEIETKIDKISGATDSPYGILWGKKDDNYFCFYLASNGYYKIVRKVDEKTEVIVKWTKTDIVNTGNGTSNILKIKKQGNYYKFYINNKYATQIDFEPFYGNGLGYIVYYEQQIAIDYLKINYLEKSKNNVIANQTLTAPLLDNFSSNTNGWNVQDVDSHSTAMVNGKLVIDIKKKGGIFVSRDIKINTSKDFVIETSIRRHRSVGDGYYGVTFGRKNSSNEYSFMISNSGSYLFRKFDNDKYHKILKTTYSSAIKNNTYDSNKIKIVKSGNTLRFYINDQYVNETPFKAFFGTKFGYSVFFDQKISVDYLDIKYLNNSYNNPPTIVITSPAVSRGFKIVKVKKITVRGKATDADGIYEILINGVEANVSEDGTFYASVPLKYGENNLVVKATDLKQASSTKKFTIKRKSNNNTVIVDSKSKNTKLDLKFGKYYALIIGNSTYEDEGWIDLGGKPIRDAKQVYNTLTKYYTFDKENVVFLKDANEKLIKRELFKLSKKVGKNDNVLIFYAGHGGYEPQNELGYIVPVDVNMEYEEGLITNSTLKDIIRSINSKHTLFISDACYSGSIILKNRSFKNANYAIKDKYKLISRNAITSGHLQTVPNESLFLKYLLKKLINNTEKYLSTGNLFNQIEEPVMNMSEGEVHPLFGPIGKTGHEGGDFIFIRRD